MVSQQAKRAAELAEELLNDASKANNLVHLISIIATCREEAALRTAIHGVRTFFASAGESAERGAKKRKLSTAAAAAAPGGTDDGGGPEAVYRSWLQRQQRQCVSALLALLTEEAVAAGAQVSAVAAVMDLVRLEQPGTISNTTYLQLLRLVLTSAAVKPEVFTLLFSRYLHLADVRYYTLWGVKVVASEAASSEPAWGGGGGSSGNGGGGGSSSGQEGEDEEQLALQRQAADAKRSAPAAGACVSPADLCRNLYDLLTHVPAGVPADSEEPLQSWCGGAESGLVAPANDKGESAKARRKRQQQQQQEAGAATAAPGKAPGAQALRAAWANPRNQKRMFSEAWLRFLQLDLPEDIHRKVLLHLHSAVIPAMTSPLLLSDFLTHSLDASGLTGMLALNGLFVLVTKHGLEYPHFFTRLYQLLTPEAFVAKHRAQFFRLADIFLSSQLVPAYTVAAFIKRFARLGLLAPPAGAMIALAFIHNLVRRHPACMTLLDKPGGGSGAAAAAAAASMAAAGGAQGGANDAPAAPDKAQPSGDVYLEAEADPAKSRAVESSLWELAAYRCHYCPQVAAFTTILDKDLTDRTRTAEVALEPLLGASYGSLLQEEIGRRLKKVPVAFYQQALAKVFDVNSTLDYAGWQY